MRHATERGFHANGVGAGTVVGRATTSVEWTAPQLALEMQAPKVISLDREATIRFCAAVEAGTGLAAFHHGLATTFQTNARFRLMAACTFASHPGDIITYRVDPTGTDDPIMAGISSFEHTSEQYYMHIDPSVTDILATTTFSGEHAWWKQGVKMPTVFKTAYGHGRVFYTALGHKPAELAKPEIRTILERGLLWAAR